MAFSDSQFQALPNGISLHFRQSGSGQRPVLFIPGWTMTTEVFERQLSFFESSSRYRFITYDPRSHGLSSRVNHGNHYEQHGRDLAEFIEARNLSDVILCGWSFGVLTVLSYLDQYGFARTAGLIMLDGSPRVVGESTDTSWCTFSNRDESGELELFTMGKLRDPIATDRKFARWMLESKQDADVSWLMRITQQTPNETAALLNVAAIFLDYRDTLVEAGGTVPIWCVSRASRGRTVSDWCHRYLPESRLSAFGEHMMFWERSERFNNELVAFLSRCRQRYAGVCEQ
ncbi:MAG: alpha/beta hydrolase [Pseudomonadota bacterium]